MRYYYANSMNEVVGPVEDSYLYQALRSRSVSMETMVTPEGSEDWTPLKDVMLYFFSHTGDVQGPLYLKEICQLAAGCSEAFLVTEPGGTDWIPLATVSDMVPVATSAQSVARPGVVSSRTAPQIGRSKREIPPIPRGVIAAGMVWVAMGGAIVLGILVDAVDAPGAVGKTPGMKSAASAHPASIWSIVRILSGAFGAFIFFRTGSSALNGTINHLSRNGVASILIGVVYGLTRYITKGLENDAQTAFITAFWPSVLPVVAGLMAVISFRRFREWQDVRRSVLNQRQ